MIFLLNIYVIFFIAAAIRYPAKKRNKTQRPLQIKLLTGNPSALFDWTKSPQKPSQEHSAKRSAYGPVFLKAFEFLLQDGFGNSA